MNEPILELIRSAWNLLESEQWDEMLAKAGEAQAAAKKAGFSVGVSRSLSVQAFVHYIRSDFQTALSECVEALRIGGSDAETKVPARGVLALVNWSWAITRRHFGIATAPCRCWKIPTTRLPKRSASRFVEGFCSRLAK